MDSRWRHGSRYLKHIYDQSNRPHVPNRLLGKILLSPQGPIEVTAELIAWGSLKYPYLRKPLTAEEPLTQVSVIF